MPKDMAQRPSDVAVGANGYLPWSATDGAQPFSMKPISAWYACSTRGWVNWDRVRVSSSTPTPNSLGNRYQLVVM